MPDKKSNVNGVDMKKTVFAIICLFCIGKQPVYAQQCDCTQVIGQCSGAIEFLKNYGANKNYGAEIVVHSSENVCSKVEYYVDSTPYENVLVNKNSEQESLFGTSPIESQNVSFQSCKICKPLNGRTTAGTPTANSIESSPTLSPLEGHWSGTVHWLFASEDEDLTVHVSGGHASGTWTSRKGGSVIYQAPFDATIDGNVLNFPYVANGGISSTATLTVNGDGTGQFRTSAGPIVFSGTMTKNP